MKTLLRITQHAMTALALFGAGAFLLPAMAQQPTTAQQQSDETPVSTIEKLFDAMRASDGATIRELVVEGSMLDRRRRDGSHVRSSLAGWAAGVARSSPGDLDERIFAVTVQQFGGIAQVHAPFIIYVRGELRGCGVNQFALAEIEGSWKVTYGMDSQHDGDCATFQETYQAAQTVG